MQPFDWSATAAWIALIISVIGTVFGPIVTALITNRHQLKLRKLDIEQSSLDSYYQNRFNAINAFLSKAGKCLSYVDENSVMELGECYHNIYQYVPSDFWDDLDSFYSSLISFDWANAKTLYPPIVRKLSEILKESHPVNP